MVETQRGLCAICGKPPSITRTHWTLVVDHDHVTGKVRGLLCRKCNADLGIFEKMSNLPSVSVYLKKTTAIAALPEINQISALMPVPGGS